MVLGTLATSCACDCSLTKYSGTNCDVKIPCDINDIYCQNLGTIIGYKSDIVCKCNCKALYKGLYC